MTNKHLIVSTLILISIFCLNGCESGEYFTGPDPSIPGSEISGELVNSSFDSLDNPGSGETKKGDKNRFGHGGMGGHYDEAIVTRTNGGVLEFWNGSLTVLPGSIDETKTIWARTYSLSQGDFFKKVYEFGPSGTEFDPDAILVLSYCDLGPLPPNVIKLRVFNEITQQWEVTSTMVNDPESKTFTGPIEHFSKYSLSGNRQGLQQKIQQ